MKQSITCKQCRQEFPAWPYELRDGRCFCSPACHDASRRNTPEQFWQQVSKCDTGCWLWNGRKNGDGYGIFIYGKEQMAHRVAYILASRDVPAGKCLDHLCRNRSCVNPAHLEPTTWRENILRGQGLAANEARSTHCKYGHEFNSANTMHRKDGGRFCRACGRRREKEYKARQKQIRSSCKT